MIELLDAADSADRDRRAVRDARVGDDVVVGADAAVLDRLEALNWLLGDEHEDCDSR